MKYVYHGSPQFHTEAIPSHNIRCRKNKDGSLTTIFNQNSFHATPYKWIALAYTYTSSRYTLNDKTFYYNMGVDLYKHKKRLTIYGYGSLEKSLKILYRKGGYVSYFNENDFHHTKGLGNLEVITTKKLTALKIEYIKDPVLLLERDGVIFDYIDFTKSI